MNRRDFFKHAGLGAVVGVPLLYAKAAESRTPMHMTGGTTTGPEIPATNFGEQRQIIFDYTRVVRGDGHPTHVYRDTCNGRPLTAEFLNRGFGFSLPLNSELGTFMVHMLRLPWKHSPCELRDYKNAAFSIHYRVPGDNDPFGCQRERIYILFKATLTSDKTESINREILRELEPKLYATVWDYTEISADQYRQEFLFGRNVSGAPLLPKRSVTIPVQNTSTS